MELKRQYLAIQNEVDAAVRRVFESGWFILGREVDAFEKEFASYCGVEHGVGVGSGVEALHLALLACDVGPGDEVISQAYTYWATIMPALALAPPPEIHSTHQAPSAS